MGTELRHKRSPIYNIPIPSITVLSITASCVWWKVFSRCSTGVTVSCKVRRALGFSLRSRAAQWYRSMQYARGYTSTTLGDRASTCARKENKRKDSALETKLSLKKKKKIEASLRGYVPKAVLPSYTANISNKMARFEEWRIACGDAIVQAVPTTLWTGRHGVAPCASSDCDTQWHA